VRASDFTYLDAPTPVAMAHRGGARYAPNVGFENTLAAFRRAVDMGYRYVETDVHATRDGHLVAFHDRVLDRVSDAVGAIAALALDEVRDARVGGSEPIPLLGELFEQLPDTRVNIDVKSDAALEPTVREILRHGATDRVCIGSFSERRIRAARSALIGACGVGEAVADHPGPALQRRADHPLHVVAARGVHQQRLGHRAPAVRVPTQDQVADALGARRTARFTAGDHLQALGLQACGEALDLGGFPRPFPAFEGDEPTACHPAKLAGSGPLSRRSAPPARRRSRSRPPGRAAHRPRPRRRGPAG